jgi:uncharacterized protein (DUF2336 family)
MRKLLAMLTGKGAVDYDSQKIAATTGSTKKRITLAADSETNREILYYLAEKDPDPKVRRAVAQNPKMPVHVGPVLAADVNEDVRLALAGRLIELLPDLSTDKHSQLYAYAVPALGMLALDEVLMIRRALSSALKDHAHAPPQVAGQLARDVEREVSEPILRFCAALSDNDLLDILKECPASWTVEAIASRESVSGPVSKAVIDTGDPPGGKALLENEGANITVELLKEIVTKARSLPEWQTPVAARNNLPKEVAMELADYAEASVRDLLVNRSDFDEETIEEISTTFHRRMEFAVEADEEKTAQAGGQSRAVRLFKDRALDEEVISDALGMRDKGFVTEAIALRAKISYSDVERIIEMKAAKPLIAICWKADLSMRMALRVQKELGHIPPKDLVYPKGGTDYPLSDEDLNWQLEFMGLE